jgi:hypothetical protein
MDISYLRKSYDVAQTWANRICIDFPADFKINQERVENFQTQLEQKFTMFHLVDDKEIFYESLLN